MWYLVNGQTHELHTLAVESGGLGSTIDESPSSSQRYFTTLMCVVSAGFRPFVRCRLVGRPNDTGDLHGDTEPKSVHSPFNLQLFGENDNPAMYYHERALVQKNKIL